MVFAVRKDLSQVKINYYLNEKIHKFAYKYFKLLLIFTILAAIGSSFLINLGISIEIINLVLLIVSVSFLFLAQTIVIDEESLKSSILSNWEFILKDFRTFLFVIVLGVISVFLLQLIEFIIDYFFPSWKFCIIINSANFFLVPFLEVLKTRIYMHRFDIIKSYHSSD